MSQNQDAHDKLNSMADSAREQHLLDTVQFENLVNETSPDVVFDILTSFKTTLRESIEQLQKSNSLSNDDLYKVCHKLKGSSLLIGFKPLGELCVKAMNELKETPQTPPNGAVAGVLHCAKTTQSVVLANIN